MLASEIPAYSSGRFTSKDMPKSPVRRTSGCGGGGGAASACGGGAGASGAGKFSHFIEYTSFPSAVRPIGAQLSTRAVAVLGAGLVCAHAGDAISRMAIRSFFIGFSRQTRAVNLLNRIGAKKSNGLWPAARRPLGRLLVPKYGDAESLGLTGRQEAACGHFSRFYRSINWDRVSPLSSVLPWKK